MVYIIKKDGTKEEFDAQKIVRAVNKSAQRILYTFSQQEIDFICKFATEHVYSLGKTEIPISDMHNIVEGALEKETRLWQKATAITAITKLILSI